MGLRVQDVGELGLLQRLERFSPPNTLGDDAAVLVPPAGQRLVVSTDVLVDGVHFSDHTTAPEDVGWRAVAANLSDLAAMGAEPLAITVGLSLPGSLAVAWVEALYTGMAACLQAYGGAIVGGDLCRAEAVSVAITALGTAPPEQLLTRRGAQPGHGIVVTGYHGSSRAGLELLLHPQRPHPPGSHRWIRAHQRPVPRFDAIATLRQLLSPGTAVAAMDTSDGLANALVQIAAASGVGMEVVRSQLPIDPQLAAWQPQTALDWSLYGGEDFELVLCVPADIVSNLVERLGPEAVLIGTVTSGSGVILDGNPPQSLTLEQGFQHFSSG